MHGVRLSAHGIGQGLSGVTGPCKDVGVVLHDDVATVGRDVTGNSKVERQLLHELQCVACRGHLVQTVATFPFGDDEQVARHGVAQQRLCIACAIGIDQCAYGRLCVHDGVCRRLRQRQGIQAYRTAARCIVADIGYIQRLGRGIVGHILPVDVGGVAQADLQTLSSGLINAVDRRITAGVVHRPQHARRGHQSRCFADMVGQIALRKGSTYQQRIHRCGQEQWCDHPTMKLTSLSGTMMRLRICTPSR